MNCGEGRESIIILVTEITNMTIIIIIIQKQMLEKRRNLILLTLPHCTVKYPHTRARARTLTLLLLEGPPYQVSWQVSMAVQREKTEHAASHWQCVTDT